MKTYRVPHTDISVSCLGYGCAGLASWDQNAITSEDVTRATRIVDAACSGGVTLFDHADVYAFGKAETIFGEVLRQSKELRKSIVIQSKSGQILSKDWRLGYPIRVELSHDQILRSVEGSLKRLGTDYLDILLLHAPDTLIRPDEVARVFEDLKRSGKVRCFGVSNHTPTQIELLSRSLTLPIVVNQIRLGLSYPYPLVDGMEFTIQLNRKSGTFDGYVDHKHAGIIDYCRMKEIQIQAWSPLRGMVGSRQDLGSQYVATLRLLERLAVERRSDASAMALAWLLRHPAEIVPIIGSMDPGHIATCCTAAHIELSSEEWYELFAACVALKVGTS